ncbi:efflux RND transporter periplasmic adaptor subunit [Pseudoalteromonas piscicida]|uniref:Efflux transporter periplasmic adaptor subunit n=1 Tax=Pseudoalteromonas piscicida TaxID=43662 RepID=A0A2A5JPK0_PSEO7|nr:HlyD family efflux transporter periplasmic adaptor subunit [Pseudoalteromonas piscicida]PCK31348.1 efflux transporter periplasmic adaptor subunit [Pseudoalteromonas piscicida]
MIKDTSGQDEVVQSHQPKKKWIILTAIFLLVGALAAQVVFGGPSISSSVNKSRLQIAKVTQGEFTRDISATGSVVAANAPQIYSPEQGYVALQVKAGDSVDKGQTLATVKSPTLTNRLQQEEAELQRLNGELEGKKLDVRRQNLALNRTLDLARVELLAADREDRRAKLSIEKNLISQIDLEEAQDNLARAKLNFNHAEQEVALGKDTLAFELKSVENQLERQRLIVEELTRQVASLTITAPVSGIVGNLLVDHNALVNANQGLMKLVDLSAYEAELQVPESYAAELGLGMTVSLKIGNQTISGVLSAISPEVNNREVTARVRFSDKDVEGIRQNQRLSARILLEQKENTLMVKRGAFMSEGGHVAYKLNGDIAERVEITTGTSSISEVEVLDGLKPGDQIIISSYDAFDRAPSILLR